MPMTTAGGHQLIPNLIVGSLWSREPDIPRAQPARTLTSMQLHSRSFSEGLLVRTKQSTNVCFKDPAYEIQCLNIFVVYT